MRENNLLFAMIIALLPSVNTIQWLLLYCRVSIQYSDYCFIAKCQYNTVIIGERGLERGTHDWKVTGSSPGSSGGIIFFSRVNFLCLLLFRYPFHPRVTAVARKRYRSFCQKCRCQVTAKHTYTLPMSLCSYLPLSQSVNATQWLSLYCQVAI